MKENNADKRRGFRRRNRPDEFPRLVLASLTCVVCHQVIAEMASAVAFGPEQGPAHFDCVLQALQERENLREGERLAYLGSGMFGVVQDIDAKNFQIVRKIAVEDPHNPPEWRKEIKALVKARTATPM